MRATRDRRRLTPARQAADGCRDRAVRDRRGDHGRTTGGSREQPARARDVHGTKAFWQQTTLKRAIAASPGTPTLKFRAKAIKPYRLNVRALHKALANTPWEHTRSARLRPAVVSLPAPNGRFQRFALPARRSWRRGSSGSILRSRPTAASASTTRRDHPRRPEPVRAARLRPLAERRLVHRPVLPPEPESLRQLPRATAEGLVPVPSSTSSGAPATGSLRPRSRPSRRPRPAPRCAPTGSR